MSKLPNKPGDVTWEETGRTKEVSQSVALPGTRNIKIFATGPIRRHLEAALPGQGKRAWPIYDWLMTQEGRWYDFHRIARMDDAGVVDLEQVAMGSEIIISPGLIYRIGIVQLEQLNRWRAAQDRIKAKLEGRFKGTENAQQTSKIIRG